MDGMESLLDASLRRFSALGWAALLPVVMLVCMVYWGIRPWTGAMVLAAAAIALLYPAVAADLLPVALIGLASVAFLLIRRNVPLPPGSGTTNGYPLHSLVFGDGFPHVVDLSMGVVLLAFGVLLVPCTIGAHSALVERNSELVGRVLRLTATRVDAVDTAAAELRRVERDLHDGAQARLVALGISLRAAERLILTNPYAAVALVAERWPTTNVNVSKHWAGVRTQMNSGTAEVGAAGCRLMKRCAYRSRSRRRHTSRSQRSSPTPPNTPTRAACTSRLSTRSVACGSRSATTAPAAPIRHTGPGFAA